MPNKVSKHEAVYAGIKEKIIEGTLGSGTSLSEREICEMFGVSRTPVREALKKLVRESFAEFIPNVGIFVTEVSTDALRDVYEVREALETMSAKAFILRADEDDFAKLEKCCQDQVNAVKAHDYDLYMHKDMDFHLTLAAGTKNARLQQAIMNIHDQVRMFAFHSKNDEKLVKFAVADHKDLMTAIRNRDEKKATELMRNHIVKTKEYYVNKRLR